MSHEEGGKFIKNSQYAAVIWLILAAVIALVLYVSYYFSQSKKKKEKKPLNQEVKKPVVVAGGRRPRRMRVRRDVEDDNNDNGGFDDVDGQEDWDGDKAPGKVGAKKLKKLEMKAEKRAERQAELEEREERKKRELALAAERKKDEERSKIEEAERAEEARLRKEEQERKEHEEYLKMIESFTVEESGEVGVLTEEESQSLLQEFIDYVMQTKVILLEDLAAHFNLKTQEAIERLENLQEMGRLTGVMDDRGKFIYISEEELNNIAKFIKQRGRVSIADLAESSNSLIKLQEAKTKEPKSVDVSA
ncbi:DDRGK domain-containing protein 1-like isoform X2 [Hydractinia symbiolongicarpus]|uniref:DDRGK domain-containing protein 1-like isoform X2 n=1 Tax=Hydractinia symbiolongicarpus TaxID=13093 RepID=UPI00254CA034|nr:DDRGK domain-containing protein 1-like isoform X2 [Hydractinia symbiolongicarpus]